MANNKTVVNNGDDNIYKLKIAIILTAAIFVLEIIGGIISGSLALLSDSVHVFTDLFSLGLSLSVIFLAKLPSTKEKTFGWHRAEIFAALINSLSLLIISVLILHEAYIRFLNPVEIKTEFMLSIAVIGMLGNLIVMLKLRNHEHIDLNVKSAYLHVVGDFIASFGVIAGAIIIIWTKLYIVDAIISAFIGILIFGGTFRVLLETFNILMEGVPKGIKIQEVKNAIQTVEGVNEIHDLHIWSVCSHITALSCHISTHREWINKRTELLLKIKSLLKDNFNIFHSTIQFDCADCVSDLITQDLKHD